MKLEFSAGGIVFKKFKEGPKIALILDSHDNWAFPKGHIKKGEGKEEAASREVSEEIGVKDLKIVEELGKIEYWFKHKGKFIHKFVYFYLMEASVDSKIKLQKEEGIKKIKWVEPEKILEKSSYKDMKPILKKAIRILNK